VSWHVKPMILPSLKSTCLAVYGQIAAVIKEIKTAEDIINTVLADAKLTLNQLRDFSLS